MMVKVILFDAVIAVIMAAVYVINAIQLLFGAIQHTTVATRNAARIRLGTVRMFVIGIDVSVAMVMVVVPATVHQLVTLIQASVCPVMAKAIAILVATRTNIVVIRKME